MKSETAEIFALIVRCVLKALDKPAAEVVIEDTADFDEYIAPGKSHRVVRTKNGHGSLSIRIRW